jgi:hypothetical protein
MSSKTLSESDCPATAKAFEGGDIPKGVTVPEAVEVQGTVTFFD